VRLELRILRLDLDIGWEDTLVSELRSWNVEKNFSEEFLFLNFNPFAQWLGEGISLLDSWAFGHYFYTTRLKKEKKW
jgi:hypothetical protein